MKEQAQKLKLLAFDVDGTLTQGDIHMSEQGECEKIFNVRDGMGMILARVLGLKVGIITGRKGDITPRRAADLKLDFCLTGISDKVAAMQGLLDEYGWAWEEAGYMGDDLNDLGVLARVGMAAVPADATPEATAQADVVLRHCGGEGAAREWIEMVLKAQNKWQQAVELFTKPRA